MPERSVDAETKPSKLDRSRTVGPPRDEQLPEQPLGRLSGDKPAYDTAMGVKPSMGPFKKEEKTGDNQTAGS